MHLFRYDVVRIAQLERLL